MVEQASFLKLTTLKREKAFPPRSQLLSCQNMTKSQTRHLKWMVAITMVVFFLRWPRCSKTSFSSKNFGVLLKHTVPNFWGLEFWDTLFLTCDDSADGTGYLRRILVSFTKSRGRWWHWKCQKNFYRWNLIFKELFLVCSANHRGRWPIKGESLNNPSKIQFPLSTTRFGILLLKENYFKREIQIRNHFLKEPYSTHKIYLRAPQSLKKLNPDGTSFLRS